MTVPIFMLNNRVKIMNKTNKQQTSRVTTLNLQLRMIIPYNPTLLSHRNEYKKMTKAKNIYIKKQVLKILTKQLSTKSWKSLLTIQKQVP